jgi:hypothetical protein
VVSPVDCRYETATQASAAEGPGSTVSIPFPDGDVFPSALRGPEAAADVRDFTGREGQNSKTSATVGSVGFGENFGFYSRRQGVTDGR